MQVIFPKVLKELRTAAGLTQEQLAARLGLTSRAISHYEAGTREPNFTILVKIAQFFDADLNFLILGEIK